MIAFAAEKVSFLEAAILIVSPVAGLQPSRGRSILHLELSEAVERDLIALGCCLGDGAEHGTDIQHVKSSM